MIKLQKIIIVYEYVPTVKNVYTQLLTHRVLTPCATRVCGDSSSVPTASPAQLFFFFFYV